MRFPDPLIPGRLVRRYKRFLADVELGGRLVTAHCPNPGSMLGLSAPGSEVWLSASRNPARKLPYTLELVRADGGLVGVNTGHPNGLAAAAIAAGLVPELAGYEELRREVRYGRSSRVDLLLTGGGRPPCYVEVKNVHLMRTPGLAEFPDARTARGAKHLDELGEAAAAGQRAVMFFLVQRGDCRSLGLAGDIDPYYLESMQRARARGVEAICYCCKMSPQAIELDRPLTLDF